MKRSFVEQAERLVHKNTLRERDAFAPQTLGEIEALKQQNCASQVLLRRFTKASCFVTEGTCQDWSEQIRAVEEERKANEKAFMAED